MTYWLISDTEFVLWSAFCCVESYGQKIFEQGRNFCLPFCPPGRSPKLLSSNPEYETDLVEKFVGHVTSCLIYIFVLEEGHESRRILSVYPIFHTYFQFDGWNKCRKVQHCLFRVWTFLCSFCIQHYWWNWEYEINLKVYWSNSRNEHEDVLV